MLSTWKTKLICLWSCVTQLQHVMTVSLIMIQNSLGHTPTPFFSVEAAASASSQVRLCDARWLVDIFLLDDSWTPVPDAIELYGNINNLQFSYADMNGPSSTARGLDNVRSSSSCTFLLQKTKSRHLICFFAICGGQHPVLSITLLLVVTGSQLCVVTMFFYC